MSAQAYSEYVIAIADANAAHATISLSCWDNERPCRAFAPVRAAGTEKPIEITVRLEPGNAYLRFRETGKDLLLANGDRYLHISLGTQGAPSVKVALFADITRTQSNTLQSTMQPVWRVPLYPPLADLLIAIRARH